MATINMASILAKAKAYTKSPQFQQKVEAKTDQVMLTGGGTSGGSAITIGGVSTAAGKFIEVLQNEVESLGGGSYSSAALGSTAISAATSLEHGTPYKIGKNKYQVDVWFSGDLHRESLNPSRYDGVDNIIALLNNGYQAGHSVYGVWHGHGDDPIYSLPVRGGLHFIDKAVRNFKGNYGRDFGVTDIIVSEVYK